MLRGVLQALDCLSIHATYCVIVTGASPGETKMWAAVHENGDFVTFVDHVKTNKHMLEFFLPSGSHTILVYRSYTDTKHRAASATAELLGQCSQCKLHETESYTSVLQISGK